VNLVNTIGVPVILVGTPRALSFLQKEFQQAKRACGQGDALWEHMENDNEWRRFVKAIWKYQYTKNNVELTDQIMNSSILAQEAYALHLQASSGQIPLPVSNPARPDLAIGYEENKASGLVGL